MTIKPPRRLGSYPDRDIGCQEVIDWEKQMTTEFTPNFALACSPRLSKRDKAFGAFVPQHEFDASQALEKGDAA